MNLTETGLVLGKIQAYSNRTFDKAAITAWHELLEPYQQQDCLRAVTEHYRHSKEWLMPSDVIERVNEYRQERLGKFHTHILLTSQDEQAAIENGTYGEQMKNLRQLAMDGHITPTQYDAYQDGRLALTDLARKEITR